MLLSDRAPQVETIARRLLMGISFVVLTLGSPGCSTDGPGDGGGGGEGGTMAAPSADDPMLGLDYRLEWSGFSARVEGGRLAQIDLVGDVIAVQDSSSVLSVLSTSTGEVRWATRLATPLTKFVGSFRDGKRLVTCSDTEAYFNDLDTGTLITKQRFSRVVNTRPVLQGDVLIFGTASNAVYGHQLSSGFAAFSYGIPGIIEANPVAVTDDTVGLVTSLGHVIILDSSGAARSRAKIFDGVRGQTASGDGRYYIASLDQSIYAFEPYSNSPRWRVRTDARLTASPTFHNGRVYIAVPTSGLMCLDAATGKTIWTAAGVQGDVIGTRKGDLLVWGGGGGGGGGGTLTTLGAADGSIAGSAQLPGVARVITDQFSDGHLYVASNTGQIRKYRVR